MTSEGDIESTFSMNEDKLENQSSTSKTEPEEISPATSEHLGHSRQYLRDMILGVNDGLVSTFLLVAGVSGGGLSTTNILITAIAGALAGAVSMSAGEYVATKSQNEVMTGEIALERDHVLRYPEDEIKELESSLFDLIGIPKDEEALRNDLIEFYRGNEEALLKVMIALEFGVIDSEVRSPVKAAQVSFWLFIIGSIPSVVPFAFTSLNSLVALIIAAACTSVALLLVGAVKTWATRGSWLSAAAENLVVAGIGGLLAYGVGYAFDVVLNPTN